MWDDGLPGLRYIRKRCRLRCEKVARCWCFCSRFTQIQVVMPKAACYISQNTQFPVVHLPPITPESSGQSFTPPAGPFLLGEPATKPRMQTTPATSNQIPSMEFESLDLVGPSWHENPRPPMGHSFWVAATSLHSRWSNRNSGSRVPFSAIPHRCHHFWIVRRLTPRSTSKLLPSTAGKS